MSDNRRRGRRRAFRTVARLFLYAEPAGSEPLKLYVRDADERGVGLLTPHRLPLGYGGILRIGLPDGLIKEAGCTVYRCRECLPGWFEGAVHFNQRQSNFPSNGRV